MTTVYDRAAQLVEHLNRLPGDEVGWTAAEIQTDLGWSSSEFRSALDTARWLWGKEIVVCESGYFGPYSRFVYVYATANTRARAERYITQYERPIRTQLQHELVMIDRCIAKFGVTVGTAKRKAVVELALSSLA